MRFRFFVDTRSEALYHASAIRPSFPWRMWRAFRKFAYAGVVWFWTPPNRGIIASTMLIGASKFGVSSSPAKEILCADLRKHGHDWIIRLQ